MAHSKPIKLEEWELGEVARAGQEAGVDSIHANKLREGQLRALGDEWYSRNSEWAQDPAHDGYSKNFGVRNEIGAAANDGKQDASEDACGVKVPESALSPLLDPADESRPVRSVPYGPAPSAGCASLAARRRAQSRPRPRTASRSSESSLTEASTRVREKSLSSRPWTISYDPPEQVTGKEEIRPSGTP